MNHKRPSTSTPSPHPERVEKMRLFEDMLRRQKDKRAWIEYLRRKTLAIILWTILLSVIVGSTLWLFFVYIPGQQLFHIHKVEYKSNGIISMSQALEILDIPPGANMLNINSGKLTQKLLARPDIKTALVTPVYPGGLSVEVQSRIPIAWIDCPTAGIRGHDFMSGMFIDIDGIAFPADEQLYHDYLKIPLICIFVPKTGFIKAGEKPENSSIMLSLLKLLIRNKADGLPSPTKIIQEKEWAISVYFDSGSKAIFSLTELPRQVSDLVAIFQNSSDTTPLLFDLTYDKNIRVSPLPTTTPPAQPTSE